MTIPVKWFHSGMTGAPLPDTAVNTLISILDACLINGFNLGTVTTLTYDSVTGKCTANVGAGHGFDDQQVILIEGANETEFNGEVRITVIDANQFSYVPATAPTVANATGAITAKAAPVGGWTKAFSGVNKAVYQAPGGLYLRVDDSIDVYGAAVSFYESMTDVDTGTGQFGAGYWRKSDSTTTSMTNWRLVGDASGFYLSINDALCVFAGRFETLMDADPGDWCLFANPSNAAVDAYNGAGDITTTGDAGKTWKSYDAAASDATITAHEFVASSTSAFASICNKQIGAVTAFIKEGNGARGVYPGLLSLMTFSMFGDVVTIDGILHYTLLGKSKPFLVNIENWGR